ncbi:uncharacterized protein LOC106876485 [Octopus bimaculoides]|uniref:EXPERA domain-containing protein n=1 Tax=Octopus bimaculoides TaxID=37653 RepID=A0A0L8GJ68_OCTBM|nr:uncharacterized protein LOC106876485 [Octopus bimaculoides]|eukprot:XP_014780534.1 PREDICTED: uncharacterized protein LOC106876485 [Octopus bimaculoides]
MPPIEAIEETYEPTSLFGNDKSLASELLQSRLRSKSRPSRQWQTISSSTTGFLPGWVTTWFVLTAAICTWDASFIMLRPLSFPEGPLSQFWYPYKYYINLDKRYGNMEDSYVYTQSLMNYAEVILNLYTCYLDKIRSRHTIPLAFTVTVMTFWKTVLYFLMFAEPCGDTSYRTGNSPLSEFFLVIIPNGVWLVLPLLVLVKLWAHITPKENLEVKSRNE